MIAYFLTALPGEKVIKYLSKVLALNMFQENMTDENRNDAQMLLNIA